MRAENTFLHIPGIGEKTEKKHWKQGITHWEEFKDSGKASEKKKRELEKAEKNLEVGNTEYFDQQLPSKALWRIYRNFKDSAAFFDIETTGLKPEKHELTTVSIHRGGETKTLIKGEDLTQEKMREELFQSSLLVSFNGKRFDQPFLEEKLGLNISTPHIDLMYPCRRIDLTGGLKKIEKDLGIDREQEDVDGREAIRLWKQYRNGNEQALQKLVEYNQYDARNLQALMEKIESRLEQQVFRPHIE